MFGKKYSFRLSLLVVCYYEPSDDFQCHEPFDDFVVCFYEPFDNFQCHEPFDDFQFHYDKPQRCLEVIV